MAVLGSTVAQTVNPVKIKQIHRLELIEYLAKSAVSLRNRTGEERRRQTLCDKRDNNFV